MFLLCFRKAMINSKFRGLMLQKCNDRYALYKQHDITIFLPYGQKKRHDSSSALCQNNNINLYLPLYSWILISTIFKIVNLLV